MEKEYYDLELERLSEYCVHKGNEKKGEVETLRTRSNGIKYVTTRYIPKRDAIVVICGYIHDPIFEGGIVKTSEENINRLERDVKEFFENVASGQ